jgi:serine/threonine protein kinase
MSPEQADGQALDHRSDLFSLGSVLYFMATGHPPFRADRPMAVLKRTCHDAHRPAWQCNAEIPDALSQIIDRLLEKKPSSRFASAGELEKALADVLIDVQQGRIGRREKVRWPVRHWGILFGAAAVAAVILAVSPYLIRPAAKQENERANVSEPVQQSAISALNDVDPSPASAAQAELDSLSEMLEALEAAPFPETMIEGDMQ